MENWQCIQGIAKLSTCSLSSKCFKGQLQQSSPNVIVLNIAFLDQDPHFVPKHY